MVVQVKEGAIAFLTYIKLLVVEVKAMLQLVREFSQEYLSPVTPAAFKEHILPVSQLTS
jgi:hypothetical protein